MSKLSCKKYDLIFTYNAWRISIDFHTFRDPICILTQRRTFKRYGFITFGAK